MKRQGLIIIIIVSLLLAGSVALAQTAANDREYSGNVSSELSGGQYVLTIRPAVKTQLTGYRLVDLAPTADPAAGCCCKGYLSCITK